MNPPSYRYLDLTYILEVDHFGVPVVHTCDVVQQDIHNPERIQLFLLFNKQVFCIMRAGHPDNPDDLFG